MFVIINQLTGGLLVIKYWKNVTVGEKAIYITGFLVVIISMNYWSGQFLGRYEVALSSFKILIVLVLMIMSLVIAFGGGRDHESKGFRYWKWPSAFASSDDRSALGVFRAIFRTIPNTTLSYLGTELIGMAVLHTREPRKAAARAIKQIFYRILAFNLVTITLLGMVIPYDDDTLALPMSTTPKQSASAFVVAVNKAHIAVLPDILNACILIFVVSAASRALCMATRILRELSLEENAPFFLRRLDKRGVPVFALGVSATPALLGYLNLFEPFSGRLWTNLVNLVTIFSILSWGSILIMHISFVRARKAQKIPDEEVPFKAPFGIFGSWTALVICISIPVMRAIELSDRNQYTDQNHYNKGLHVWAIVTSYLGIPLYFALVLGYKIGSRRKGRSGHAKVELTSGRSIESQQDAETDGAGRVAASIRAPPLWKGRALPVWLI
ncbi:Putative Amino acid transporter (Eurofung) [Aspergillus calidoustus]|uniref:Putative Amino acid transporter (Eurofung) n=1 Tax=Aspergillus calidoustus TaxID=454130 RepID=A0A0U5G3Y9_ASPCI|nr:Putative Amino acid transporter (Eurofung) [Aspergillus calidoustus]